MLDKHQFRKLKYEIDEYRNVLPDDLNQVLDKTFELFTPFVSYIIPAREELKKDVRKLLIKQYPVLNEPGNLYLVQCIKDITDKVSESLSERLYKELLDIEAGINSMENLEDYQWSVKFYTRPHEPIINTIEDYNLFDCLTYDEKVDFMNEYNTESIAACDEYNSKKTGFVAVVQPTLFKYYGEQLNNLDTNGWERYAVIIGRHFYSYHDYCYSLISLLLKGLLEENPGMSFFEYKYQISMKDLKQ